MTVEDLLGRVSSRELTEWMIFYGYEPFGYETELYGSAIVASVLANIHRKKGSKEIKPDDFIPRPKPKDELRLAIGIIEEVNKSAGGVDNRNA